jgi:hypothetical protein
VDKRNDCKRLRWHVPIVRAVLTTIVKLTPSWLATLIGLPLLLAGMHLVLWRSLQQPAPLHARLQPASGRVRVGCAVLGPALC